MVVKEFKAGKLKVRIFKDRESLGKQVAADVQNKIREILELQNELRMIFAAAPSQNEFLSVFRKLNVSWERIIAFHMDEYIGIELNAVQRFGNFLNMALFNHCAFHKVNYINPIVNSTEEECKRYSDLITDSKVDICAMGIGENGHLAFNDPPVADFNDKLIMKTVELDMVCRQQQVNDGCFSKLNEVPTHAFTLTIPALLSSEYIFVTVPGRTKAEAVYKTLNSPVTTDCPSTILRNYPNAILYLDKDSSSLLGI